MGLVVGLSGCQHPSVTAVSLNTHYCDHKFAFLYDPCKEPEGIPFYLPKPLLIVAKNFRNVEEAKVGLTDGAPIPGYFDDQSKYADLNSRSAFSANEGTGDTSTATTSAGNPYTVTPADVSKASTRDPYSSKPPNVTPNELPLDGLLPEHFYTYQIVFVPDMTQKYGLKVKGGVGEIRAALNIVNGWQFTGLGPYYMKDSSTAQNTLAAGITANLAARGIGDAIKDIASINPGSVSSAAGPASAKGRAFNSDNVEAAIKNLGDLKPHAITLPKYAEITIYEAFVTPDGMMEWKPIHDRTYDRTLLGALQTTPGADAVAKAVAAQTTAAQKAAADAKAAPAAKDAAVKGASMRKPSTGTTPFKRTSGGEAPMSLRRSDDLEEPLPLSDAIAHLEAGNIFRRDPDLLLTQETGGGGRTQTPPGNLAPVLPAGTTQVISNINNDKTAAALLAKRLLGQSAPVVPATALAAAPTPITVNQFTSPAAAPAPTPAPAPPRQSWFHREKPRSKIQTKVTQASGVGMPTN